MRTRSFPSAPTMSKNPRSGGRALHLGWQVVDSIGDLGLDVHWSEPLIAGYINVTGNAEAVECPAVSWMLNYAPLPSKRTKAVGHRSRSRSRPRATISTKFMASP
jgi:hypothetical protein